MDATGTIHMGTGSASNSGNGGNGDGDSRLARQTRPNSTSDGVMLILTLNSSKSSWYANVTSKPCRTKVNFRTLFILAGNGIDVVVPMEFIRAISERFANTAYGYFLGNQVTYPVNANYVKNTWVQTSSAVVSLYLNRGNLSTLAVGKSSGSGNAFNILFPTILP
nr:hypothetical protein [Tanacetum cinerariifolium]